jgi:hypothetical protein
MARLAVLTEAECRLRLEQAWRLKAPKKLVAQREAAAPSAPQPAKPKPQPAKPKPQPAKPKPQPR